jgi:hypothetical protein
MRSFERFGTDIPRPPKQLCSRHTKAFGERQYGRERRVAPSVLYRAYVVRRKPRTFGELLEGQPESFSFSTDGGAERHMRKGRGCMPSGERPIGLTSNPIVVLWHGCDARVSRRRLLPERMASRTLTKGQWRIER